MDEIPVEGSRLDRVVRSSDAVQVLLYLREWLHRRGEEVLECGLAEAGGDLCKALCILDAVRVAILLKPDMSPVLARLLADIDSLILRDVSDEEWAQLTGSAPRHDEWSRAK